MRISSLFGNYGMRLTCLGLMCFQWITKYGKHFFMPSIELFFFSSPNETETAWTLKPDLSDVLCAKSIHSNFYMTSEPLFSARKPPLPPSPPFFFERHQKLCIKILQCFISPPHSEPLSKRRLEICLCTMLN